MNPWIILNHLESFMVCLAGGKLWFQLQTLCCTTSPCALALWCFMQIDSIHFINISQHGTMPGTTCLFARCLLWKSMTFLLPSLTRARGRRRSNDCSAAQGTQSIKTWSLQKIKVLVCLFCDTTKLTKHLLRKKKTRWRKFAHATCPLTMFQASNPKAGLARIEFLKAMLYFWFGSCRDMQRDDGMRRLPESNTRLIRSRNISNHIFVITIFMNIHDIYIVSRSNISAFHDISCAFVVSKTVDGIWPEVRQGAWRPSLQASKLGNFRNSLDEHFETRAAKDFRREQQNVIHFKSRLKVSGFSFHLLSQCFSF
jgi:hypothetical protein